MRVDALLIGVGPGAACSREVLGLGVPQVTATADSAAARDFYYKQPAATCRSSPTAA